MPVPSVTDPPLRLVAEPMPEKTRQELMQPLERQLAATRLAIGQAEPDLFVDQLAPAYMADVRYAARVAVNLLDKHRVQDAILRARDQVAYAAYGSDYSCQPPRVQMRINHIVQHSWDALRTHLQGISEPLRPSQRLALQPEKQGPKAVARKVEQ